MHQAPRTMGQAARKNNKNTTNTSLGKEKHKFGKQEKHKFEKKKNASLGKKEKRKFEKRKTQVWKKKNLIKLISSLELSKGSFTKKKMIKSNWKDH